MQERRKAGRRSTFAAGTIIYNACESTTFCVVRDLSEVGARLEVASTEGIPETFRLLVSGAASTLSAKVTRRSPNELGVTF